jgi:hypothetical protein
MTSNTSLHSHISKYHFELYVIEADRNKWQIFIDAAINAFKMGYTFKTLIHALGQPGVTSQTSPFHLIQDPETMFLSVRYHKFHRLSKILYQNFHTKQCMNTS